ncbi:MAG: ORF6N domain-containing protein, partial [Schwartzia sp.]|nr:ORF6N domain-containing protein [Schwartzia sp. (in: firmicutes)]
MAEGQLVDAGTLDIRSFIYMIRGHQVMLDSDLAMLYQVETRVLNQAVKRNLKRFPTRYCFQLTKSEAENLTSQIVMSSSDATKSGYGGRRHLPYAFTEQGIAMLSAVLRSEVAIQTSLRIMDTFVEMRRYLANTSIMYERLGEVEARQISYQQQTDEKFEKVFAYLAEHEEASQKIFFDGQIYDAFSLLSCLIQKAEKTIVLIDNYVDTATLNLLAKKKPTVNIRIYTHPKTRLTDEDVEIFNRQYPRLEVHHTTVFHDRFLVVDRRTVYHIGASLKDAGKKCFAVSLLEDEEVGERLIARA